MNSNTPLHRLASNRRAWAILAGVAVAGVFLVTWPRDTGPKDPKSQAKEAERAIGSNEESYAPGNVAAGRTALKEAVRLEAEGKRPEAETAYRQAAEQFGLAVTVAETNDSKRTLEFPGGESLGEIYTRADFSANWRRVGEAKGAVSVRAGVEVRLKCLKHVNDAHMEIIAALSPGAIQSLVLGETGVTDVGLKKCVNMQGLTDLALYSLRVGDDSVLALAGLPSLRHLNLSGTDVTDRIGPGLLDTLPMLESLNLQSTDVSPAIMPHVLRHTELSVLVLPRSCSNDEQVKQIVALKKLKWLSLEGKPLTQESVPALLQMSSLEQLLMPGAEFSDAAYNELHKGLPACRITL